MNEGERMKGATMTENRPRDAVDLLYEAAEFAGFDAGKGWPEELEPGQFVALMVGHEWLRPLGEPRPLTIEQPDGWLELPDFDPAALETGTEKNRKRRACRIAEKRLKDAGLAFEKREDFFTAPPKRLLSLDPTKPVVIVQPSPEMRRWFVVTRKAASDCLKRMGKVPGEYIRAWLGDAWPVAVAPSDVPIKRGTAKPARKAKNGNGDRLAMAMIAGLKAYRAKHKTDPTADALFEWLAENDETGTIDDANDVKLWWRKADGDPKTISRKAFANRLTTIKAKTPA